MEEDTGDTTLTIVDEGKEKGGLGGAGAGASSGAGKPSKVVGDGAAAGRRHKDEAKSERSRGGVHEGGQSVSSSGMKRSSSENATNFTRGGDASETEQQAHSYKYALGIRKILFLNDKCSEDVIRTEGFTERTDGRTK